MHVLSFSFNNEQHSIIFGALNPRLTMLFFGNTSNQGWGHNGTPLGYELAFGINRKVLIYFIRT